HRLQLQGKGDLGRDHPDLQRRQQEGREGQGVHDRLPALRAVHGYQNRRGAAAPGDRQVRPAAPPLLCRTKPGPDSSLRRVVCSGESGPCCARIALLHGCNPLAPRIHFLFHQSSSSMKPSVPRGAMIRFACPTCGNALSSPMNQAGAVISCSHCKQLVQVPQMRVPDTKVKPTPAASPAARARREGRTFWALCRMSLWALCFVVILLAIGSYFVNISAADTAAERSSVSLQTLVY